MYTEPVDVLDHIVLLKGNHNRIVGELGAEKMESEELWCSSQGSFVDVFFGSEDVKTLRNSVSGWFFIHTMAIRYFQWYFMYFQ